MEFLALVIWLLLATAALAVLPGVLTAPGAGIAALAAFGGFAAAVLWIVLDAPLWTGWVQVGMAVLGMLGATLAAAHLLDGERITGGVAEEVQAAALGLQLPFYGTVLFVALIMSLQITEPVV
jgi:hypothetical protein